MTSMVRSLKTLAIYIGIGPLASAAVATAVKALGEGADAAVLIRRGLKELAS